MAARKKRDEFTRYAESVCVDALRVCYQIMSDEGGKSAERLRAAEIIIERARGKAKTQEGGEGTLTVRFGGETDQFAK